MPRVRLSDRKKLTAYPELAARAGSIALKPEDLQKSLYVRPPESELYRTRYGRALNLDRIENALVSAQDGYMRDLTDLARETIALDPHLSAVIGKRINAVASVPYTIEEASGPGVDPEKAKVYAALVREQLANVPHFRQSLKQLAWAFYDGRAALEIQWVLRAGPIRYFVGDLSWIHPRRLQFGPDRELRISDDIFSGQGFQPIGLALRDVQYKFVEFRPQLFGEYPEREGLAPRCLYWSFFKRFGARDRMILLELFGKPWRIVEVDEDSNVDDAGLKAAEAAADRLGGPSTTARMPQGTKLKVEQVGQNAGQVHADVIAESDRQISKLVLGQTGTTDPMPGGLNGQQSVVMENEQALILVGDCELLGDCVEDYVTDAIIALNFGVGEVVHAPRFVLRPEKPRDRKAEADRVKSALDAGMPLAVDEVYEVVGFRRPNEGEARIEMKEFGNGFTASRVATIVDPLDRLGNALKGIDPEGAANPNAPGVPNPNALPSGESEGGLLNKSDMKIIVKVNEARAQSVPPLPPLTLPDGSLDPDGELTVAAYESKQKAFGEVVGDQQGKEEAGVPPTPAPAPPAPPAEPTDDPENDDEDPSTTPTTGALAEDDTEEDDTEDDDELISSGTLAERRELELVCAELVDSAVELMRGGLAVTCCAQPDVVALANERLRQPETANGSLEDLIDRGVNEAAHVANRWTTQLANAVEGKSDARAIYKALKASTERFDMLPFARAIERRLVHSMMAGALDSMLEAELDQPIAPSKFERVQLAGKKKGDEPPPSEPLLKPQPSFTKMPYKSAVKHFQGKSPIGRSLFARLSSAAKQRAFTVAGLASEHALKVAKSELENALTKGTSLADFSARLKARFESAGFSVPNKSHLETVFRTNLLGSYNAGRKAEMSQPESVELRPYWRILTVPDARRRETHGAVHGWVLSAKDPFWRSKGGPPWGFNCRCRVYSLSKKRASAYTIHLGSEISSLPDKGFDAETVFPT